MDTINNLIIVFKNKTLKKWNVYADVILQWNKSLIISALSWNEFLQTFH